MSDKNGNEGEEHDEAHDQLEGSILGTRLVLQALLEKGLPQIQHTGYLMPFRERAEELLEPNLRYRSPAFERGARAVINALCPLPGTGGG